jgi:lysozyme
MGITCGSELGVSSVNATKIQANGRIFLNSGSGIQADPALRPNTQTPPGQTVPSDGPCNWQSGEAYADGSNIVARVPQHEPWEGHDMVTPGQRGHVEQAPLDKKLRSGAVSETADKPLDKTTPDGKRFEGKGYDEKGNPIFEQVDFCPEALAPISERSISQKGLDTIKRHEGVRNQVYNDAVGKPTVGVGHLITAQDRASGRFDSGTISDEEVDALLKEDIATIEAGVKRCIKQPLTQEQYDACVSLAFNIGVGSASGNSGFCGSTATQQINSGDYDSVPNSIMRWNKGTVNGKKVVIKGLDNRRKQEAALFAGTPEACAGRPASQPGEVMPQTASSAGFDTSGGQSSLARQNSPDQG